MARTRWLRYLGPHDAVELTYVDDEGRVERQQVERGKTAQVREPLASELVLRDEWVTGKAPATSKKRAARKAAPPKQSDASGEDASTSEGGNA